MSTGHQAPSPPVAPGGSGYLNSDREAAWHPDITAARTAFESWYLGVGRDAFCTARSKAEADMSRLLIETDDLTQLDASILQRSPAQLGILRMCTAPRLARDRLTALAYSDRSLVGSLEAGRLPARTSSRQLGEQLDRICAVVRGSLDPDLFGWVSRGRRPSDPERERAIFIVADRRCDAIADQIVRQAQRRRQLQQLADWLTARNYRRIDVDQVDADDMESKTFCIGQVAMDGVIDLRVDALVSPARSGEHGPVAIKAVASADANKMSKRTSTTEEFRLLDRGPSGIRPLLLLGGSIEKGYLQERSREGLDWVWEHRLDDLARAGL